jgi:hypothetical protein
MLVMIGGDSSLSRRLRAMGNVRGSILFWFAGLQQVSRSRDPTWWARSSGTTWKPSSDNRSGYCFRIGEVIGGEIESIECP